VGVEEGTYQFRHLRTFSSLTLLNMGLIDYFVRANAGFVQPTP
jgi:hypothetical protein